MPKLLIRTPEQEDRHLELEVEIVVGRDDAADLQVVDTKVSRRHCRIYPHDGQWSVEDLGSSNGTRVNGAPIKTYKLSAGDQIAVGRTVLVFREPAAAPAIKPLVRGAGVQSQKARRGARAARPGRSARPGRARRGRRG